MTPVKSNKADAEQIILLLNEAQKLVVQVRASSIINNSVDITALNNSNEDDQTDPLRVPEIIIIIGVLLLWFGSILIFIRHSELLRIRQRDIPYRSSGKPPMNLNHITVVNRTSDMVIHSKPRLSSPVDYTTPVYNHRIEEYTNAEITSAPKPHLFLKGRYRSSMDSNNSIVQYPSRNDQLLNPYMIPSDVRQSLLDLHRKSMENLSTMRYSMSYSTNDVSRRQASDEQHLRIEERCVQESPV